MNTHVKPWKFHTYFCQKCKALFGANISLYKFTSSGSTCHVIGSVWICTLNLLHDQLWRHKHKLSIKYGYFCNHYGGPWGKYSYWFFLGLSKIICTRLMMNLNMFESTIPLRKRVKGISQLNSFILAYWQRDINLNPQHILKLDELLLNMVNFQKFFLNFTDIFQSFPYDQPEILLYLQNKSVSNSTGKEIFSFFTILPSQVRTKPQKYF